MQASQVFYALDQNAVPLLRKAVLDTVRLRRGKDFVCNIPGICNIELPGALPKRNQRIRVDRRLLQAHKGRLRACRSIACLL